jgi:cytoskeletal protein RodZ
MKNKKTSKKTKKTTNKKRNKKTPSTTKKRPKRNKLLRSILIAIVALTMLLGFLLLLEYEAFEPEGEEQFFPIADECSLVLGNLLHPIQDTGDCSTKCRNECTLRELTYTRSEFATENNSCNVCDCYCK